MIELKGGCVEVGDGVRQVITNQEESYSKNLVATVQVVFAGSDSQALRYTERSPPKKSASRNGRRIAAVCCLLACCSTS